MPNLIVSTCGTSLFTNAPCPHVGLLRDTANLGQSSVLGRSAEQAQTIESWMATRTGELASAPPKRVAELSAELNGILAFHERDTTRLAGHHHILLVTDTWQGQSTGEAIASWLRSHQASVDVLCPAGLSTGDFDAFGLAINDIVAWAAETIPPFRQRGYRVVFNLVGGFKSVQAYMTLLGMLYADETIYLFEGPGSPLLRIPRLPIKLDPEGVVDRNLLTFRLLSLRAPVDASQLAAMPETMLDRIGDEVQLSSLGQIVWQARQRDLYAQRLLSPPHASVMLSPRFEEQARGLRADRYLALNRRVDQLVSYQLSGGTTNPRSLHVHALQGKPVPGCTHECYAWSDEGAARIYMRFDGARAVLETLGEHL